MAAASDAQDKKILHVAPEAVPFCKVGGLADVAGSLPLFLSRGGADCRLLLPAWDGVLDTAREEGLELERLPRVVCAAMDWRVHEGTVWRAAQGEMTVYFLESPLFRGRKIYPDQLDSDSVLPFVFLSYAALELENAVDWRPDVIHCHDWGTAPLVIALAWHRHYRHRQQGRGTAFTIHNLAHQGLLPLHSLREWGIEDDAFTVDGLEYFGVANLMKGAIIGASAVTTVSPTYAREIQTDEGGAGLGGLLRSQGHKVRGILNGLDTRYWDPAADPLLPSNYSSTNLRGKKKCRDTLFETFGWRDDGRPLFSSVSRMVDQKGFDILLPAIDRLLDMGCRLFFVGNGQKEYEDALLEVIGRRPDSVAAFIRYDERMAHLAYAAADFFLMPSKFEPCGLSQLIALLYGAPPVARSVGGLADTVFEHGTSGGNGFLFFDYSADALLEAVGRARALFRDDRGGYRALQREGMNSDFSWNRSAPIYRELYQSLSP